MEDKKTKGFLKEFQKEGPDSVSNKERNKEKYMDHKEENRLAKKGLFGHREKMDRRDDIAPLKPAAQKGSGRDKLNTHPADELSAADPSRRDKERLMADKRVLKPEDGLVQVDELIYSKELKKAPRVEKTPTRSNTINQIHNGKVQISLKAAIKERTNPVQVNAKQMEDDAVRQQEAGNRMNEEVQRTSDEADRIREEQELEQIHKEESAAQMRAADALATGAIMLGVIDALDKPGKGEPGKKAIEAEKTGLFGRLAGLFRGGKIEEEEIIEDGLSETKSKALAVPQPDAPAKVAGKTPTVPGREELSATMERFLAKSDARHSLSAPTGQERSKKEKGKNKGDDSLMPQR